MIKKLIIGLALGLIANCSCAGTVYDGYESYYQSMAKPTFNIKDKFELKDSKWKGLSYKKYKSVIFKPAFITINNTKIALNKAYIFDGEPDTTSQNLIGDYVFFSKNYLCIEALDPSASGTASRHKSIYLIETEKLASKKTIPYKLPSLFGSCLGVRLNKNNKISFDKISYYYETTDLPAGVIFEEFEINDHHFKKTGEINRSIFVELNNVYKFEIKEK